MVIFTYLFVTGLGVGLISSFFGVGGGIIAIPMLYTIFPKIPPQTVIACSMGMIFMNAIINTYNFHKKGKSPNKQLVSIMGISITLGVILGGTLAVYLDGKVLKLVFASITTLVAIRTLFFGRKKKIKNKEWERENEPSTLYWGIGISFVGGIVAGLTGLGGGAIIVPLFISILQMPFAWVPVYSNVLMGIGTGMGAIRFMIADMPQEIFVGSMFAKFQVGYVNWGIVGMLFIGAFFTSKLGVILSEKVPPNIAKNSFALLLLVIAAKIFYSTLLKA